MIHPQEALLQEARAFQQSEAFAPYRELRQAAEHRLARLMQLGVRQARYFGRTKTLFQLLMAATVANLTLVATKIGLMQDRNHPQTIISIHVYALFMVRHVFATLSPRSELGFSATLLVWVELADFRGEETLVVFWNPGCGFCQQMLSDLREWEQNPPEEPPSSWSSRPERGRPTGSRV